MLLSEERSFEKRRHHWILGSSGLRKVERLQSSRDAKARFPQLESETFHAGRERFALAAGSCGVARASLSRPEKVEALLDDSRSIFCLAVSSKSGRF